MLLLAAATQGATPNPWNEHDHRGWWHGQAGQDHTVAELFGDASPKFFVDLAANYPVRLSNTRALERDHGWDGLCIEGNELLVSLLAKQRRCRVVHALLGAEANMTMTNFARAGLGAAAPCTASALGCQRTTTLAAILDAYSAPRTMHYLSLDIEGMEDFVLRSFAHERYRFLAMTVERPKRGLTKKFLPALGYRYAFDHGGFGDQLWIHSSIPGGFDAALQRARASYGQWKTAMFPPHWTRDRSARKHSNVCGVPAAWVEHGVPPPANRTGEGAGAATAVHVLDTAPCSCRGVC